MINDDDPTQSLPDKDRTTQPTLEAILDRMQGFETRIFEHLQLMESRLRSQFEAQIASLREEMTTQNASLREEMTTQNASLREEVATLRDQMNAQFRLVANKIDVLNEDSLSLRASQRELLKRMGELETRAS